MELIFTIKYYFKLNISTFYHQNLMKLTEELYFAKDKEYIILVITKLNLILCLKKSDIIK